MISTLENAPSDSAYRKGLKMAKAYFLESDEKYTASLLLAGAILSIVALVALTWVFSWWIVGFWAALTAMKAGLFFASLKTFALISVGWAGLSALKTYFVETLERRWRNWLLNRLANKYNPTKTEHVEDNHLEHNTFIDVSRVTKVKNIPARILEDSKQFVETALSLGLSLIESTLSLGTFIGTLWVVGGSTSFMILGAAITIPGYLVWTCLLLVMTASLLNHLIGQTLAELTSKQKTLEADARDVLGLLGAQSESVALERGELYYHESTTQKFTAVYNNTHEKTCVKIKLNAFQKLYQQLSPIIPYIVSAPLYFAGLTSIGQLMQIGFSFDMVNLSLNWFINSYGALAEYIASITRITELEDELDKIDPTKKIVMVKNECGRTITEAQKDMNSFALQNVNIGCPKKNTGESTDYMMRGLNLTFNQGENTIIKGPSGLGKSTLLKVMARTWKHGEGEVSIPKHQNILFLPQTPSLQNDTFRAVLAYPKSAKDYDDAQYIEVLRAIGNMEKFITELDTKEDWSTSTRLSGGQRQRILFARALLQKPDWICLDESTSALDEDSQAHLYSVLKHQLPNATLISVAHIPSVEAFHQRVITLNAVDTDGKIQLTDGRIMNTANDSFFNTATNRYNTSQTQTDAQDYEPEQYQTFANQCNS